MDINGNIEFDSSEETYFYWWCEELRKAGYIEAIVREPRVFKLSDSVAIKITRIVKGKPKVVEKDILKDHIYTVDFGIKWLPKAKGIFYDLVSDNGYENVPFYATFRSGSELPRTFVEVKPKFDKHNMQRLFIINQKWVYQKYNEYIELVIFEKLFELTFTPVRFLLTNKTSKSRVIKHEVRTLQEFLATFEGKQKSLF